MACDGIHCKFVLAEEIGDFSDLTSSAPASLSDPGVGARNRPQWCRQINALHKCHPLAGLVRK
jgi:hypothetical protein